MKSRRSDGALGFAAGVALCLTAMVVLSSAGVPVGQTLDGLSLIAVDAKRPDIVIKPGASPARQSPAGVAEKAAEAGAQRCPKFGLVSRNHATRAPASRRGGDGGRDSTSSGRAAQGRDLSDSEAATDEASEDSRDRPLKPGTGRVIVTVSGLPKASTLGLDESEAELVIEAQQGDRQGDSVTLSPGGSASLELPEGVWDLRSESDSWRRRGVLTGVEVKAGATVRVTLAMTLEPGLVVVLHDAASDRVALGLEDDSEFELRVTLMPLAPGLLSPGGRLLEDPRDEGLDPDSQVWFQDGLRAIFPAPERGRYLLVVRYQFGRIMLKETVEISGEALELIRAVPSLTEDDLLLVDVRTAEDAPVTDANFQVYETTAGLPGSPIYAEVEPGRFHVLFPTLCGRAAQLATPWMIDIQDSAIARILAPVAGTPGRMVLRSEPVRTVRAVVQGLPRGTSANVTIRTADDWLAGDVEDGVAVIKGVPQGSHALGLSISGPMESSSDVLVQPLTVSADTSVTLTVPPLHELVLRTDFPDGTLIRLVRGDSSLRALVQGGEARFRHLVAGDDWQLDGGLRRDLPTRKVSIPVTGPVEYNAGAQDRFLIRVTGPGYLAEAGFQDGDRLITIAGRPIATLSSDDDIWNGAEALAVTVERASGRVELTAVPRLLTRLDAHLGGRLNRPSR